MLYGLRMRKIIYILTVISFPILAEIKESHLRGFQESEGNPVMFDPETEKDLRTYVGLGVGVGLVTVSGCFIGCAAHIDCPINADSWLYWAKMAVSAVIAGGAGALIAGEGFEDACVSAHCQDVGNDIGLGMIGGMIGAAIPALGWYIQYRTRD